MSGGSYNYLCFKDARELLEDAANVEAMAARLAALGYADAARETEELLCVIRQAVCRIEARGDRLRPIWKAVEWFDSSDWGRDSVEEAVLKYREQGAE